MKAWHKLSREAEKEKVEIGGVRVELWLRDLKKLAISPMVRDTER